ncbi:iron ABC transporter permease [Cereibacter sphaeroides]|uniref:FecCD family ABC transporter permease n=1 Tax=Cereibacter sphaeroides TaxID=1063 RepID=UPI001F210D9E|nr:iron ABC transporter permease [Cereibacter sphaeroides]MCE6951497.1 iron ABC transporter permease [Cereibacter sphaeroides]MCE6960822.1 iron ABC transporter permease [Cereibacter sphaeroides]MCE6969912.1 iron ABC transporter permease [Cereibacter sphaeroides]MCE6974300.1 iron ABC transporter permease [Cereibacter sphaeroides]
MRTLPLLALVLAASALSLGVGVRPLSPGIFWQALTAFDATDADHVTLLALRLPRLAAGLVAGAALGIAGTMMQALTRNPLADPGLLGVNAGAACAIVAGGLMLGLRDEGAMAALAFPGAALASVAVFALGGGLRGDAGPVRLTLAGAALNALLLSVVSAILLIRQETLDVFRFWVAGSLTQAAERPLAGMALVVAAAGGLALAVAPAVEALSLGAALARGLGVRPGRVQAAALAVVALATGAAVTVAGPIAFLGLMVPPLARRLAGHALRAELLVSAAMGAAILLLADTAGRVLIAPAEVRAGVMTALIGGPVFILIARRIRPGAMA